MFTKEIYEQALIYFETADKPFYNLLKKHGHLKDAPNYPIFVNMTRCILTQWVYLRKSNKVRHKIAETLGNHFTPTDILKLGVDGLVQYGADKVIAERAIRFAEYCTKNPFETLEDIFKVDISGIGKWTKNVTAVTYSLSENYPGPPYNALTTGDPVVRKGIWVLHGIEAYNSYIDSLNQKHAPWGGILTWYLWREFNHKSIKVPRSYASWNTETSCASQSQVVVPPSPGLVNVLMEKKPAVTNTRISDFFRKND